MIPLLESLYPLESVAESDLQKLARTLWKFDVCNACQANSLCDTATHCSWAQKAKLERYFTFYKDVTSFYVPELLPNSTPALRNHQDLLDIIQLLQAQPSAKRSELTLQHFSQRNRLPVAADQHRAFNLAVQVMTMVNCSADNQPSGLLELGTQPIRWHSDESLAEFMERAFPAKATGALHVRDDAGKVRDVKTEVSAKRLKRGARLTFRATDDLRNHLRLDAKKGAVEIYHHTSVLKQHLLVSLNAAETPVSFEKAITMGNIPRQIALEVLDSIGKILFPLGSDSENILRKLISDGSFDPDCLHYASFSYRRNDEEDITYRYFGARLLELFEELEDPSPRGILEKWFQRKSGARYVMMATLIGVAIAVILGLLGLAVAIFQAWVAYEAWKHPVEPGS